MSRTIRYVVLVVATFFKLQWAVLRQKALKSVACHFGMADASVLHQVSSSPHEVRQQKSFSNASQSGEDNRQTQRSDQGETTWLDRIVPLSVMPYVHLRIVENIL